MGDTSAAQAAAIQGLATTSAAFINSAGSARAQKKAIKYNKEMYERQREDFLADREHAEAYDSPAAQRARLVEAGLNPYLMMEQGSTGQAQSPANIEANPGQFYNTAEPLAAGITSGVASAVSILREERMREATRQYQAAQTREANARAEYQEIENDFAEIQFYQQMGLTNEEIRKIQLENDFSEQSMPIRMITQNQQYQNLLDEHELNLAELTLKRLQAQHDGIVVKYLPQQLQADISLRLAQTAESYARHDLTMAEVRSELESIEAQVRENALHKYSDEELSMLRRALYNETVETAKMSASNAMINNPANYLDSSKPTGLKNRIKLNLFGTRAFLRGFKVPK